MQISARGDYAVRATLSLATAYPRLVPAGTLARQQGLPRKFLEAVLADLRRGGIVRARRGADGGYTLTVPPRDLTVKAVLDAVDPRLIAVGGRPVSDTDGYVGPATYLPQLWLAVRTSVRDILDAVSLADLASGRLPDRIRRLATRPGDQD